MSIPTSQYIPPPHFPWVTISLFSTSGMPLLALHTAMYIQGRSQHLFSSLHHHSWTNQQLGENSLLQHMPFDWETRQKVSKHFSLMFASHVFQELFHPLYISSFVQSYMMIIALSCDIQQHHFLKFIYLFLAVLGLRCRARASSSCGEQGLLFIAVRGLLVAVASLVAEHGL